MRNDCIQLGEALQVGFTEMLLIAVRSFEHIASLLLAVLLPSSKLWCYCTGVALPVPNTLALLTSSAILFILRNTLLRCVLLHHKEEPRPSSTCSDISTVRSILAALCARSCLCVCWPTGLPCLLSVMSVCMCCAMRQYCPFASQPRYSIPR